MRRTTAATAAPRTGTPAMYYVHDDHDDHDDGHEAPPAVSRLGRVGSRRYRVLSRATDRSRGSHRYPRLRKQLPLEELIGQLIRRRGLTDEVRQRAVCLYWSEIAGE